MSSIKELKLMNEAERILWFAGAKSSDLTLVLKNEGIKGISKMKKAEKLAMVLDLVVEDTVTDKEIDKVIDDTKKLTEELNVRQSNKEELEATLYARWCAKEITWEEFKNTIINRNISIPINVADEEDTKYMLERKCDLCSEYEHYVFDTHTTYYSILNKDFEWDNVHMNYGKYVWDKWTEKQFYKRNTVDEDGIYQLAFEFDEDCEYTLVYKKYELLGAYKDGNIDDIKRLVAYDDRLYDDDLETYTKLLEILDKQRKEYHKMLDADKMLRKKFNFIKCKYKKFSSFAKENPKRVY